MNPGSSVPAAFGLGAGDPKGVGVAALATFFAAFFEAAAVVEALFFPAGEVPVAVIFFAAVEGVEEVAAFFVGGAML